LRKPPKHLERIFDIVLDICNCYSTIINNAHITDNIIAKEVINRLALKVRGMLRILHMPDVKDGDMRELIIHLGQTSK
jgi:hypothetical protein